MAEEQHPVTHGELVEIVRRLDERISSMDRNINERISSMDRRIDERFDAMGERISSMDRNMTEMRSDIRMLTRAMLGFYAFIIAAVGVGFTLYKLFPNPTP